MEKEKDNELTHMWAIKQKATNKPNSQAQTTVWRLPQAKGVGEEE